MTHRSYRAGEYLSATSNLDLATVIVTDRAQVFEGVSGARIITASFEQRDAVARKLQDDGLAAVLAAEDDGAELAAQLSERLGLRHHALAAVQTARSKAASRAAFQRAGLVTPWHRHARAESAPPGDLQFPAVLKPAQLAASRGVRRVNDESEFKVAWGDLRGLLEREGLSNDIVIEGYIPGDEVAVEGLMTDGELRVLTIFDKPDPLEGPFFEETIYTTPSRHPQATQRAIEETTRRMCEAVGLSHGPIHAEMRINDEGIWPLEVAPRSIGGLCSRALRFGDGNITLEELILRHAIGEDVGHIEREKQASGVMMIPIPKGGILREVRGKEEALATRHINDIRITIPITQQVVPWPEGNRYLGFVFARADTPDQVEEALRQAHAELHFVIE